ncbi:uncharacterized protein SOCE836_009400 [Sorangium cellulosum]|uniref:Uncharacterized protein n=1 Tax=Sorangium cellulosum TaxID=56 RepID=A0A4P2QGC1_SORCE|nr:uncharacterized protein SOCE836_009400 [Sorangium cellulosum]
MDVYCEVCGIVTTVSGGARGGAAIECRVCGSAMLGARGRGTAGLPAAGAAARSIRPPPRSGDRARPRCRGTTMTRR